MGLILVIWLSCFGSVWTESNSSVHQQPKPENCSPHSVTPPSLAPDHLYSPPSSNTQRANLLTSSCQLLPPSTDPSPCHPQRLFHRQWRGLVGPPPLIHGQLDTRGSVRPHLGILWHSVSQSGPWRAPWGGSDLGVFDRAREREIIVCRIYPILERGSAVLLLLLLLLLLRHAQGTPPGFWNGVDWRAMVEDKSPQLAELTEKHFFLAIFLVSCHFFLMKKSDFLRVFVFLKWAGLESSGLIASS